MAEGEESVGNGVSGSRTTAAAATLAELQALRANQARLEGLVESLSLGRKPIPPPPSLASTMASQAQLVTSTPPIDFDGLILGDGVEYRDWSSYMELVMAELGYTDHLEARTPTDPPSSTWVIADRKARFALFKGLSKPDIALAMRYKTVGEAWEFFKTRAGRTGALNLHKQLQLVASCQQDRTEGAQAFLARLRALQRDVEESLAAYEFSYPEPLTVWHLLTGLRSDYEACKLSLYTHNVTALDAVLQALVLHEEALRHSSDSDKLRRVQATSPSPSPKRQQSSSSSASPSSTSASSVSSAGGQWAYHQPLTGPGCNVCGDLSHNYSKCAFYVRSVEILKRAGRLIPRGAPNTSPPPPAPQVPFSHSFIVDSGAQSHAISDPSLFSSSVPVSESALQADGSTLPITRRGHVPLGPILLQNVALCPDLADPLLSVSSLVKTGYGVWLDASGPLLYRGSELLAQGSFTGEDFVLGTPDFLPLPAPSVPTGPTGLPAPSSSLSDPPLLSRLRNSSAADFHIALGHASSATLKTMGLPSSFPPCAICIEANLTRAPIQRHHVPPREFSRPLAFVAVDLVGPFPPAPGEYRYAMHLLDGFSRHSWVVGLVRKDDAAAAFRSWWLTHARTLSQPLGVVHSDRGGEFLSQAFRRAVEEAGGSSSFTAAYTPEHNGLVERANRTVGEMSRAMMLQANFPSRWWLYAWEHASYLYNSRPHSSLSLIGLLLCPPFPFVLYPPFPSSLSPRSFSRSSFSLSLSLVSCPLCRLCRYPRPRSPTLPPSPSHPPSPPSSPHPRPHPPCLPIRSPSSRPLPPQLACTTRCPVSLFPRLSLPSSPSLRGHCWPSGRHGVAGCVCERTVGHLP